MPQKFDLTRSANQLTVTRLASTMAEAQKHWGVTGSISFARPTEEEVSANAALIEELKAQVSFESAEESQRRFPFVWLDY